MGCALVALGLCFSSKGGQNAHWPSYLESSLATSGNAYAPKDTPPNGNPKRPATTEEATELGWKKAGAECVSGLGFPWAYEGTVTEDAPVTLYFTEGGNVNGIAVHYFNDAAPLYLVERGVFEKGDDYDTIYVTF